LVYAVKTADASKACALLSSGAAAYDALTHLGADKGGKTVGVHGVGGLGQCAIKVAKQMGNKVIAFSSVAEKKGLAEMFGADEFCLIEDAESRKKLAGACHI
jgi:D-arabinose 1-dehydrogenase-like Zn-dependent alcohol dehydrogenase